MRLTLLALIVSGAALGCSSYASYAGGPAFVAGEGGRGLGLAAEAASGTGSSSEKSSTFLDARARALLVSKHLQLAALAGVSSFRWLKPDVAFVYGIGGGFGLEYAKGDVFVNPVAQGRVGTGFTLSSTESIRDTDWWGRREAGCPSYVRDRKKRVLTLSLVGDVDARLTRSDFFSLQLLVGVAFVEENGIDLRPTEPLPRGHGNFGCP